MANRKIKITRSGNNLSVTSGGQPDPFHVSPDDTLCFACDDGEFAVLFHNDRTPYASGKKSHAAHRNASTTALKIRGLTRDEQRNGENDPVNGARFKYGVAVLHPTTGTVLKLDPDIIIDDGGSH